MKNKAKISELTNEKLLEVFLSIGDIAYFGELYKRYIPLTYGLCLKYLNNSDAAHDAVMDIFEDIVPKIKKYEIKNFHTWLYSVTKNHCLHTLRKDKQTNLVNIEDVFVEKENLFTLIDKPQTEEEIAALEHCMKSLPENQRISINFFYLEDKSYADIVEITGFTLNNVKSFIQNGKRNLKSCIISILKLNE